MVKHWLKILILSQCFFSKALAQNLVPNPSFEDTVQCPYMSGQITFAPPWFSPTLINSSYFNSCNIYSYSFSVPSNIGGFQFAKTGVAYSEISLYDGGLNRRTYLQVELTQSLIKEKEYCLELYASLLDSQVVATNEIGIFFSDNAIFQSTNFNLTLFPQLTINLNGAPIQNKTSWQKLEGVYKAAGGEKYIIIGNFKDDLSTDTTYVGGGNVLLTAAVYYIDDVSVICCDCEDTLSIPNIFTPNGDGINDVFKIENLPENSTVTIYNRWGIQIFESTKPKTFWDGRTTSGEQCSEGVYFYIINTKEKSCKGYLQLVR